jgi:hypothetical protein
MGELVCCQQCLQSIACFPFSQNLNNKDKKTTMKKKWKMKKRTTLALAYTSILQTMSSPLCCVFWFQPVGFLSKTMPYKLNHNLICLEPRPCLKALRPIQSCWSIGMLDFIGPSSLDPCLKRPFDSYIFQYNNVMKI